VADEDLAACDHDGGIVVHGLDDAFDDLVQFFLGRNADLMLESETR